MTDARIKKVVIVGGGTAGWMTAAALAHRFKRTPGFSITLIESPDIGTVGVGEATVPSIREFLSKLNIDEGDFVARTNGTFKLGIRFDGWAGEGSSFYHPFADHGVPIADVPFLSLWARLQHAGHGMAIDDFNLGSQLAARDRFAPPRTKPNGSGGLYNYALHFDAKLAARYLRSWSEINGVIRVESTVNRIHQHPETGFVEGVQLASGETIEGQLFVDCSGFRGLLIEQGLSAGYDRWADFLPCDRAIALPSSGQAPLRSATIATATEGGWMWNIPLQHRQGNGHVYCSAFQTDEDAERRLRKQAVGAASDAEPVRLKFNTGVRRKFWDKNVYAIGLAAGFLEPLESTGIYLIQTGISLLLSNFPSADHNQALQDEVNYGQRRHWERVRDFIIMHYTLNGRRGEPFWDEMRTLKTPEDLSHNIELYKKTGRLRVEHSDFFQRSSWVSMFSGFGVIPDRYHPQAEDFEIADLCAELKNMAAGMADATERSPLHEDFIAKTCPMDS